MKKVKKSKKRKIGTIPKERFREDFARFLARVEEGKATDQDYFLMVKEIGEARISVPEKTNIHEVMHNILYKKQLISTRDASRIPTGQSIHTVPNRIG